MMWSVVCHHDAETDLQFLGASMARRIVRTKDGKLTRAPIDFGAPLCGNLSDYRKLRVGDCRVVYLVRERE